MTFYNFAMWLTLLLSIYVVAAYTVRLFFAYAIKNFDIVSDWLGYGGHGIGMSYMSLLMLGKIANLISNYVGMAVFGLCACVFAWRLATGRYFIAWQDWVHLGMGISMAYMYWNTSQWVPYLTSIFCVTYLFLILYYLKEAQKEWKIPELKQRIATLLGNLAHVAIGIAMLIMFIVVQWPQLFGIKGGCMPGMMMIGCPFGR